MIHGSSPDRISVSIKLLLIYKNADLTGIINDPPIKLIKGILGGGKGKRININH